MGDEAKPEKKDLIKEGDGACKEHGKNCKECHMDENRSDDECAESGACQDFHACMEDHKPEKKDLIKEGDGACKEHGKNCKECHMDENRSDDECHESGACQDFHACMEDHKPE